MGLFLGTIILPCIVGVLLLLNGASLFKMSGKTDACKLITAFTLVIEMLLIITCVTLGTSEKLTVFHFASVLSIGFKLDGIGRVFAIVMGFVWTCAGFFSFEYMKHEENPDRFYGFYLIVLGILMGLCFSGNLVTYYAFYELMTIGSFALVLHNQTREAIMASLKYLFYSFAGAYMVLFGLYFVYKNAADASCTFTEGGILDMVVSGTGNSGILYVSMLLMILGFSVKAGMFPMHGWLPTAHPVAPAPASAVLSAIIVKAGVLGIIRVIYYIFGTEFFSGSYVQTVVLTLSLITVFMGSMLAYKEKILKKRLAYSTVSQVSYILFGLFIISPVAFQGAMIHVAAHAAIKSTLFMCAGAIIYITGATRVDELRGIGKKMPVMLWCYTIVSLGLIGIPPFGGFASKWYLCLGALDTKISVFSWLGPVVLLVSALLTAGYLLPISINGFLPGADFEESVDSGTAEFKGYMNAHEPCRMMLIPIVLLTLVSVLVGLFPNLIIY